MSSVNHLYDLLEKQALLALRNVNLQKGSVQDYEAIIGHLVQTRRAINNAYRAIDRATSNAYRAIDRASERFDEIMANQ